MIVAALLALVAGYLLGSIPSADIAARSQGTRIFEVGSSNMGAMNTARNLGWGLGVAVLLADIGKGALASLMGLVLARLAAAGPASVGALWLLVPPLLAGIGAVSGHAWSIYVGFRGGKGLATVLGTTLPLYPLAGLSALVLLIALMVLLRRVALASVCVGVLYPFVVAAAVLRQGEALGAGMLVFVGSAVIAGMVIHKHLPEVRDPKRRHSRAH